ncbi:hypothetical protein [Streptomyces sp. MCC20]|uniref:hypothetical protein n=1 Tax=Streptomyces sediminimaris TaxID=3383721 RepID=UPI00399BB7C4
MVISLTLLQGHGGSGQVQQSQIDPDVAPPPKRVIQRRAPEVLKEDEAGELPAGHRRQEPGRWPTVQDTSEVVQCTPGHRCDGLVYQLVVGPREVGARGTIQLADGKVTAVQP